MKINNPTEWTKFITNEANYHIPNECCGGIAIDCGSNVGALELRNRNRFEIYYCYDILQDNIDTMHKNLEGLGVNYKTHLLACSGTADIMVPVYAYATHNGSIDFFGNYGNVGTILSCEAGELGWSSNNKITELPSVTIEQILKPHKKIKLLKVDIEGVEYEFLGGKDLSMIEYIVGELHFHKEKQNTLVEHIGLTHDLIFYDGGNGYSFKNRLSK